MKFYLYKNKTNIKEYTIRLIEYLFKKYNLELMDAPEFADIVMVSCCDSSEIIDIEKAKKHGKPVMVGGMVSEVPIVNELADYAYHGEIYGLIDFLVGGGVDLEQCKYITTKNKKALKICEKIKYEDNPVIRVGSRAAYYYCGKGCPVKCKYCMIGNSRKYQIVPEPLYRKAERSIKKVHGRMMPIAAYNPYVADTERSITEVLLRKYTKHDGLGLKKSLIRSGVEFCTKELSKCIAKGVTIDDLNEAIRISKRDNSRMILYFIAGLETQEQFEDYFSQITPDYTMTPAVTIVFTYLSPQQGTLFADFNLTKRVEFEYRKVFYCITQKNKRFKVMPVSNIKKSTIRCLIERCETMAEYNLIKELDKKKYSYQDVINHISKKYPRMVGTDDVATILRARRGRVKKNDYWA